MALATSLALALALSEGLFLAPGTTQTGAPLRSISTQERLGTLPSRAEAALPDGRWMSVVMFFTDGAGASGPLSADAERDHLK